MNPRNLFAELKRRNVYKVSVAYAMVAWLLIQIPTQVFPFFDIPNWAVRLVLAVVTVALLVVQWRGRDRRARRAGEQGSESKRPEVGPWQFRRNRLRCCRSRI